MLRRTLLGLGGATLLVAGVACELTVAENCGRDDISPGETHPDLRLADYASVVEGTYQGTVNWLSPARSTTIRIDLRLREETASASLCARDVQWVSLPMSMWVRTDDGRIDVVYEGEVTVTGSGADEGFGVVRGLDGDYPLPIAQLIGSASSDGSPTPTGAAEFTLTLSVTGLPGVSFSRGSIWYRTLTASTWTEVAQIEF